ncbi:MAG: ATP-binding protein [Anaerotignum sp.]|nr:ATP-binding protein [Anaerotignum sp.]
MVEVCVSDTGIGIQEDKLEDIFKSFEQVDTSLTSRHGGTGLGLSITKQLVELHRGTIKIESRMGVGSKFRFTLPVSKKEPENNTIKADFDRLPSAVEPVNVTAATKTGSGAPVLLVDDDAFSLQAAAILRTGGYAVTAVSSGKAALAKIREGPAFSLVILDVMMPQMSGYEVSPSLERISPLSTSPCSC